MEFLVGRPISSFKLVCLPFFVPGRPAPAGSKRMFLNRKTGKPTVVPDSKYQKPWMDSVRARAIEIFAGRPLLTGPLALYIRFIIQRSKGHYGTGRNAGTLKASAPPFPTVKPDNVKLARGTEDALTGVVWRDDSQVVLHGIEKIYGDRLGAWIAIYRFDP